MRTERDQSEKRHWKKSNRSGCCRCHRWWRTEEKWTVEEEEEKLRSGDDDGL